ncbi:MAG: gas vesicle protein GvpN [Pirellula sp.]|jgi:gas vesicle protein GvpN|nr:gas vesicle protein GvpN [Pirellula sp.]
MQEASIHRGGSTPKVLSGLPAQSSTADFIPQPGPDFVATEAVQELTNRALAYIEIGYAVHLSGPAGTGKTTLALHIASKIGRRCTLLHGDDELRGSDLLGKDAGFRRQSVRDNYVSSILKTEETVSLMWSNNRLTTACEQGHTVIYDEFTRSPAAANNAFLSILEEGILNIPSSGQDKSIVRVHPDFRAIFTSNPEEYVGVHKSQDALLDRMITLEVAHQDRETEIAIVRAKSNRSPEEIAMIVDVIRTMRERFGGKNGPTIRAALAIARILDHRKANVTSTDPIFMTTCRDVLFYNSTRQSSKPITNQEFESLVRSVVTMGRVKNASDSLASIVTKSMESATEVSRASLKQDFDPSNRIDRNLDVLDNRIQSMNSSRLADIALGAKNDVDQPVLEKKTDDVDSADDLLDVEPARESVGRRFPRPPAFESVGIPLASVVSKK